LKRKRNKRGGAEARRKMGFGVEEELLIRKAGNEE